MPKMLNHKSAQEADQSEPLDDEINRAVHDDEELDRIIFFPSMVVDGDVSYSAFKLITLPSGSKEKYLSVFRASLWSRLPSGVKFRPRLDTDRLVGYATLLAAVYRTSHVGNFHCTVSQEGRNVFHAGVRYYNGKDLIKGDCDDPDFIDMLMDFAITCRFTEFEGESS